MRSTFVVVFFLCIFTGTRAAKPDRPCLPNPKNIIILIGDGMGFNHIQASNCFQGVDRQAYQDFPVRLAMAHYPARAGSYDDAKPGSNTWAKGYNTVAAWSDTAYLRRDYTESAAAATAMATGQKTYNNSVGMSVEHDTLENLTGLAKKMGKATGVVTSVPFSHATPAGFVAHNVVRTNYPQIAYDMILGSRCDVIMGCGDPMYDNDGVAQVSKWKSAKYVGDSLFWSNFLRGSGSRTTFTVEGKLRSVNDSDGDGKPDPWFVIRDRESFRKLSKGKVPARVFGCPHVYSTLQQSRKFAGADSAGLKPFETPFNQEVPTLSEMAEGALNVLSNNPKGFFLMIEGGAIDWAAHGNQKGRLIEEMTGFNDAVNSVISWVEHHSSWDETLVIVTGDHETGLLWGETPFAPILSNGKGALPVMNYYSKDHTNSLIAFYAKGCGSELYRNYADERDSVRGLFIQNSEIPQLIKLLWYR